MGCCSSSPAARCCARRSSTRPPAPFASPSAFVRAHAVLPESHEILRTAQAQHRAILGALEAGDGEGAERLTREHAGMALGNLHVVLREHGALNRVPGGTLIRLSAAS